ncbi:MAG: nuclear transport factor 2 family protein [Beijerinckiaceae bacterium]|nr:nuclear transport factor 2 family protein [Beijerinckiaceae bacterium]MCZ8301900.1 nuclear transport factor 2 family protein [Beijerinckiaceae bacterium]
MDTAAIAKAFTAMLKAGQHIEAAERFNAPDIVSLEAMPGDMAICRGTAAVKAKSDWWYANHEIHSAESDGPLINGDQFLMRFSLDVTPKMTGQRMQMEEFGLYTVRDGRIVEERFFYPTA